jgi:thiamine-phosphate pyrophosphorylase
LLSDDEIALPMIFELPRIYPITDISISGLSHLEQVKRFAAGGAVLVQLRDKHASTRNFYEAAKEVISFAHSAGIKILINDRVDIAIAVGADGVHLGQDDLPAEFTRKLLGEHAIIGFSTHSLEQAISATALPINYIAIGPVFATTTKENPDPVIGTETVRTVREAIGRIPLVAIGGINRDNCSAVLKAGASSVAIVGDLLKDPDSIAENLRTLNIV